MKEYVKVFWNHQSEQELEEPVVLLYEVDLEEDRYAVRLIEIDSDGSLRCLEDPGWGFVTETPVPKVEEINTIGYGEEFCAYLMTGTEFEEIWRRKMAQDTFHLSEKYFLQKGEN